MRRIGVFICHCGVNIAGTVDVAQVSERMAAVPGVEHSANYIYMCSEPGQQLIREAAAEKGLDALVVACCSPSMHEKTFRKAASAAGVNPFLCEIANIREQCSWVHQKQKEEATDKAADIILSTVRKLQRNEALEPITVPLSRRALVVGGGLAGLTAALDVADGGYPVTLVEREPILGGKALELSRTYPRLEEGAAQVAPLVRRAESHPRIEVLRGTEVEEVKGYVGNFDVTLRSRGCSGGEGEKVERRVGAVIVATGFSLLPLEELGEYGGGEIPDVIDGLAMERMLDPSGATGGRVVRPSDGKAPREVVFVQCAGSRDPERHMAYCSRVCCMYTAKQARLFARQSPAGQAYVFGMDVRADGKGFEEFVQEGVEKDKILYLRGRVSRVYAEGGKVMVAGVDTLGGGPLEIGADLVVLATAVVPSAGARDLAERLRATTDRYGFMSEAHIKLYPVESATRGVLLAGCAQGPKDMTDTAAQAAATASKVQSLFAAEDLTQDPLIASVDEEICSGCAVCVAACPYEAREVGESGASVVHEALCQGCGACVAACPNKASELRNTSAAQVLDMVEAFIGGGA